MRKNCGKPTANKGGNGDAGAAHAPGNPARSRCQISLAKPSGR